MGTMAGHARGTMGGSCPLCQLQEDQHDYAKCLRTAKITVEEGILNITTSRGCTEDPQPGQNPPGLTPGTTSKSSPKSTPCQPDPGSQSPSKGTAGEEELIKG